MSGGGTSESSATRWPVAIWLIGSFGPLLRIFLERSAAGEKFDTFVLATALVAAALAARPLQRPRQWGAAWCALLAVSFGLAWALAVPWSGRAPIIVAAALMGSVSWPLVGAQRPLPWTTIAATALVGGIWCITGQLTVTVPMLVLVVGLAWSSHRRVAPVVAVDERVQRWIEAALGPAAAAPSRLVRRTAAVGAGTWNAPRRWTTWVSQSGAWSLDRVDEQSVQPITRRRILGLGAAAVAVRLVAALINGGVPLAEDGRIPGMYVGVARSIADGRGIQLDGTPFTLWPPGYPIFVSLWVKFDSVVPLSTLRFWVGAGQALLAGAMVVAVGWLVARRLGGAVAVVAAALLAFWPNQVIGTSMVMTEGLFTPLYALGVVALLWRSRPRWYELAASGLAFGAAIAVRPTGIFAPLVAIVLVMWIYRNEWRRAVLGVVTLAVSALLLPAPWLVHTNQTVGSPVISTYNGYNLCMGNADAANGQFQPDRCRPLASESDLEADQRVGSEAVEWIVANPARQPELVLRRVAGTFLSDLYATFELPGDGNYAGPLPFWLLIGVSQVWWMAALYLTARGWWRGCRNGFVAAATVLWLTPLVPVLITIGDERFHDPMIPLMAICSAIWIVTKVDRARSAPDGQGGPDRPPTGEQLNPTYRGRSNGAIAEELT